MPRFRKNVRVGGTNGGRSRFARERLNNFEGRLIVHARHRRSQNFDRPKSHKAGWIKLCGRISFPAPRLKFGSWWDGRVDSSKADRIPANPESAFPLLGSA